MSGSLIDLWWAICGVAPGTVGVEPGLWLGLFGVGLVGSFGHCAGMCGPFVMSQVASGLERIPAGEFGEWQRLRRGALIPYHLGRTTTYAALGAIAGGVGLVWLTQISWIASAMLAAAAVLLSLQAFRRFAGAAREGSFLGVWENAVATLGRPFAADPRGWHGYGFGLALGFLPCGLIYGALLAASGSGGAWQGTETMTALVYLIPIALALGSIGLLAFLWSIRSGQYDDLDGAAHRILFDDLDSAARSRRNADDA